MAKKDKKPAPKKKAKEKDAGPQDLFEAVSKAVSPLSSHLQTIAKNTQAIMKNTEGGMDKKEPSAETKFEGKNMFSKMFAGIKNALVNLKPEKEEKKGGIFGWIKDNWGKLLAGVLLLGPLFLPLDTLVDMWKKWFPVVKETFKNVGKFIMEHPILSGISVALLAAFGPGGVLMGLGGILKGGLALAKFAGGAAGPMAIISAIAMMIMDGIAGADLAGSWGVGKTAGIMGAILGGTGKGIKNAFKSAGKWALLGAGIGSVVPIVGTLLGGLIGAVVGGLMGFFGGERISGWIQTGMNKLGELWDGMIEGLGKMVEDFNVYLIQPIKDFAIKIFDWISKTPIGKMFGTIFDKLKPMVEDFKTYLIDPLVNFFGLLKDWAMNAITSMLPKKLLDFFGLGGGTAEEPEEDKPEQKTTSKQRNLLLRIKQQEEKMAGGDSHRGVDAEGGSFGISQGKSRKDIVAGLKTELGETGYVSPDAGMSTTGDTTDPSEKEPAESIKPKTNWNDVAISPGVSDKGMAGTNWSVLGGLKKIKDGILSVWNKIGIEGAPTFTSGKRSADTNKKSGGKKTSQHIRGSAFDLRNNMIAITDRDKVLADLQSKFGSGIKGIRHKELDGKPNEHFHFQLAAKGFSGTVDKATGFIAGEDGPERVDIIPLNDPSARMDGMNKLHDERMASQGGTPSINVITSNQVNNSSDQSAVVMQPQQRPKEILV